MTIRQIKNWLYWLREGRPKVGDKKTDKRGNEYAWVKFITPKEKYQIVYEDEIKNPPKRDSARCDKETK